jgi:curved DNA-binding protein CbpA
MSKQFSILGFEPRPWVDPADVAAQFRERARACHPDAAGGDAGTFERLSNARNVLTDHALRLSALAELHDSPQTQQTAPELKGSAEMAFRIAPMLQKIDGLLAEAVAKASLERVLVLGQLKALLPGLVSLSSEVDGILVNLAVETRALDANWPQNVTTPQLRSLADRWKYAQRWREQIRLTRFAVSGCLGSAAAR